MSRSQPANNNPNPCERWFEWDGALGVVRYYDKDAKKNIEVGKEFTFILLDELAVIKGWNDASDSGITSNEIRDSRAEPLVVKSYKGGVIASGFYNAIKDRVAAAGGNFTTNLYIAFMGADGLKLGSLQLKGAALHAWVDFVKANRKAVYEKSVQIKGSKSGKKGKVIFETPVLTIREISEKTNTAATVLDAELQEYLKGYFKRTRSDQAKGGSNPEDESQEVDYTDRTDHEDKPEHARRNEPEPPEDDDQSIPF